jgi:NADH dehydrogenase/NADH:ubiquinone oxidoreductase subunit G
MSITGRISIDYHKGFARFPVPKRVYRVKAEYNPDINGYWICDTGRYGYGYLNGSRLEKVLNNNGSKNSDVKKAIENAAKWIVRLRHMNKTKNIILVLNTWLSNEELYLIKKIFNENLSVKKIYFVDLPDGKGDDILMTAERTPNKRGARELGFDLVPFELDAINKKTDMIIVFGLFMALQYKNTELYDAFGLIKHKILFTPNTGDFTDLFDLVLPVSLIPEKAGSLTNIDGIIQEFTPVLEPAGDSRAEWDILVEMAKIINIDFKYYKQFLSPDKIRTEMGKEIPFFRK